MFRKFLTIAALSLSLSAVAAQATIDTSGLTDAQVAEIKAIAAKKVADVANSPGGPGEITAGVNIAAAWGSQAAVAAEGFAKAMGIAAKELNITINDFIQTDAGKITAALIIWKVAGDDILNLFYGIVFIVTGMVISRVIYLKLFTKGFEKVEYSRFGGLFKGTKLVRIPKGFSEMNQEGEWLVFWVMIAICMGSLAIGGAIIT